MFAYPNPFTDICTIRITSAAFKEGTLRVFDTHGVLVLELPRITLLKGVNEIALSMAKMPAGSYFITCQSDNSVLTSQTIMVK